MEPRRLDIGHDDLYIHLAADGGIFVAPGHDVYRTAWITDAALRQHLDALGPGATVWLSEAPSTLTAGPAAAVRAAAAGVREAAAVVDTQREGGTTALISAAYVGALDLLDDLVARGAGLEDRDDRGGTALVAAAQAGQTAAVERLVTAGADIEATDAEGTTGLMYAAWSGHPKTVTRLLALGADPDRTRTAPGTADGPPMDAAALARGQGHDAAVAALERHRSITTSGAPGPSATVADQAFAGRDLRRLFTVVAVALAGFALVLVVAGLVGPSAPVGAVVAVVFGLVTVGPALFARSRARRPRVAFAGDRVEVTPGFSDTWSFVASDVVRVRQYRNQGGLQYRLDLRGERRSRYVPITAVGGPPVEAELLRRVVGVPGIEMDGPTAKAAAEHRS